MLDESSDDEPSKVVSDLNRSENINYSNGDGKDQIMSLFVDDGVQSRGHRKNLFDPDIGVTGNFSGPHS